MSMIRMAMKWSLFAERNHQGETRFFCRKPRNQVFRSQKAMSCNETLAINGLKNLVSKELQA